VAGAAALSGTLRSSGLGNPFFGRFDTDRLSVVSEGQVHPHTDECGHRDADTDGDSFSSHRADSTAAGDRDRRHVV